MMYHLTRLIAFGILKVFFWARFVGMENIPKKGALILCSNHKSNFDPVLVSCHIPRKVGFMAKEELFRVPVFGSAIRGLGAFPIRRGAADSAAIKRAIDLLKGQGAMVIFPQGTRRQEIKLEDFKRGAALLATRSGSTVVPVGISGKYSLFGRPTVRFGKPMDISEYIPKDANDEKESFEIINKLLYDKIKELTEI